MIILLFTFYCEILQTKHKSSIVKKQQKTNTIDKCF